MRSLSILVIEDDADLREGLVFSFSSEGNTVVGVGTKKEGDREIGRGVYDLVLLDCNLPDASGFEFCRQVRRYSNIPMIMLTARDSEMDEIQALELGVNDYLSKPFSLGVLKARIKRMMRAQEEQTLLCSGTWAVDRNTCRVYQNGTEVFFSRLEYKLLLYMMENKNHVLSKEQILEHVWDRDGRYADNNTVSVTISRLRAKVEEDAANPMYIRTVHGIGYLWKEV